MNTGKFIMDDTSQSVDILNHEFLNTADIESAYNDEGEFTHLVAKMDSKEFYRNYSLNTEAAVFIQGHWLTFSDAPFGKMVTNRQDGRVLFLHCAQCDFSGEYVVKVMHGENFLFEAPVKSMNYSITGDVKVPFEELAEVALSGYFQIPELNGMHLVDDKSTTILVQPEDRDDSAQLFSSASVCMN